MFDPYWPAAHGSFERSVPIPSTGVGDAPFVCLAVNVEWMQYVIGCLKQLMIPATWGAAEDPLVIAAQQSANDLIATFVEAADCGGVDMPAPMLRFTVSCGLETSIDGGSTWDVVPGWLDNAPACFAGFDGATIPMSSIDPGDPPDVQSVDTQQRACNIAAYLATTVLRGALTEAQRQAGLTHTALDFGIALLALVPGIDLAVVGFAEGANILYQLVDGANLADFTAASTDETLWSDVVCAIYGAIVADGEVTAANFVGVSAALAAITYAHTEVPTALALFWSGLGLQAVRQAQITGALEVGDCTSCPAPWCYVFDFTSTSSAGGWGGVSGHSGQWFAGVGFESQYVSGFNDDELAFQIDFTSTFITSVEVAFNAGGANTTGTRVVGNDSVNWFNLTNDAGLQDQTGTVGAATSNIQIYIDTVPAIGTTGATVCTSVIVRGAGICPFGEPNC